MDRYRISTKHHCFIIKNVTMVSNTVYNKHDISYCWGNALAHNRYNYDHVRLELQVNSHAIKDLYYNVLRKIFIFPSLPIPDFVKR